jgi:hypothetical protein
MARIATLLAALTASLVLAAGASAQVIEDGNDTVGPGQVHTDPASEVEAPDEGDGLTDDEAREEAGEDEPVASDEGQAQDEAQEPSDAPGSGKRGEIHVLGGAQSSGGGESGGDSSAAAGSPASEPAAGRTATGRRTLPFTGVDAGPLAALGLALLAAGMGLRRRLVL